MKNTSRALLLLMLLALGACGFHLRGSDSRSMQFAFKSLYLKVPGETVFVSDLRHALLANKVTLVDSSDKGDLVLEIVSEQNEKQILSLSGSGRVREYQLSYHVSLRAYDVQLVDWLSAERISLSRILAYDDAQIIAMEQEEAQLLRDMRSDAVSQAMRRLSRAKPQP